MSWKLRSKNPLSSISSPLMREPVMSRGDFVLRLALKGPRELKSSSA
eukprot:CAMPEP_0170503068 /NCGR_PEP_ID=MMETSP0208-20121228/43558_1 /TAXON_ID=197538 /ORGANISM="Strombidium inclinatum, Strain S3" /LENGTH=46 /DNA_ID= /DNA_START= /DNA_END= /DNA_ORIENTATION=